MKKIMTTVSVERMLMASKIPLHCTWMGRKIVDMAATLSMPGNISKLMNITDEFSTNAFCEDCIKSVYYSYIWIKLIEKFQIDNICSYVHLYSVHYKYLYIYILATIKFLVYIYIYRERERQRKRKYYSITHFSPRLLELWWNIFQHSQY